MGDAHRRIGLVDVLAAGARGAVGIDAALGFIDLDVDGIVDHRIDPDRGEAGVAARRAVIGRNAHQTVHAAFGLEPAIGVMPQHADRGRLDAGLFAVALFQPLDLVAVLFRPAGIHAQQHLRPVLRLGAAGAGVDFDVAVVVIGLARQQGLQFHLAGAFLQDANLGLGIVDHALVAFHLAQLDQFEQFGQLALGGAAALDGGIEFSALAHDLLRGGGVVPQVRILGRGIELVEAHQGLVPIEMALEQRHRAQDVLGERLDLGAHVCSPRKRGASI